MNVDGSSYLSHRLNEARLLDSFVRLEDIKKWFQVLFVEINHSILAGRMNRQKHVADQVMDFIIKQYNTDLGLDEIASKIGYSPGYLGGLFKQHTGRGFSESLTEHRIKKAEELLRTQTYSIMDIAKTVGFESASYFNTVFKKAYGVTPAEFRRIRSDEDEENA
jgi:YesN/AraC family two-component response regulator